MVICVTTHSGHGEVWCDRSLRIHGCSGVMIREPYGRFQLCLYDAFSHGDGTGWLNGRPGSHGWLKVSERLLSMSRAGEDGGGLLWQLRCHSIQARLWSSVSTHALFSFANKRVNHSHDDERKKYTYQNRKDCEGHCIDPSIITTYTSCFVSIPITILTASRNRFKPTHRPCIVVEPKKNGKDRTC